jgi:hypothetical protein
VVRCLAIPWILTGFCHTFFICANKIKNMKKSIKVLIIIAIIVVLSLIMVALEQGAGIGVPKIIIAIILIVVVPIIWKYEPNN